MLLNIFTFVLVATTASGVLSSPLGFCPPGLVCGHGPVCTIDDCDLGLCAAAPVCQKRGIEMVKRDPTPVNHPCPEICNEQGLCGCALESALKSAMKPTATATA